MRLTNKLSNSLSPPKVGNKIFYDEAVSGFGLRITAGGSRSFVLNYRTTTGRERRLTIGSVSNWSVTAARQEASRLMRLVDSGEDPLGLNEAARAAPTVNDMCDRFVAERLHRKRASTQIGYLSQIDREIRPTIGACLVADLKYSDVDSLHRRISSRNVPYRANRVIALLSSMLALAVRWGWRSDNPAKGIERNYEEPRRRYLTIAELERLSRELIKYKGKQAADVIRLLLITGARSSEVRLARWDQVDLAERRWNKKGTSTKQKDFHSIPLSEAAMGLISRLRRDAASDAVWLFPSENGGPRKSVQDAWEILCKRAEIRNARIHDLRHTYASLLASAGMSLPIIGALLGHRTPATTARYAHLFDDPLRIATERASDLIGGTERRSQVHADADV